MRIEAFVLARKGGCASGQFKTAALDRNSGLSRWRGDRVRPVDIRGRRSGSADPAATIGQAWPGLFVVSFGLIAHGQSRMRQRLFPGRGQM